MNLKTFLLRFAGLALFTLLGWMLLPIIVHLLIMMGIMPTGEGAEGFGNLMMQQAMFVYMGSIIVGFAGIFIKDNWRWVLYLCPLYASSAFAAIYTIFHH